MALWNRCQQRGSKALRATRGKLRGARCRPRAEALEERTVPSAPGTLDPTFGSGGTVSVALSASQPAEFLKAIAIQPDGKIVAAGGVNGGAEGGEFAVARFDANGGLDTTFGSGGSTFTSLASFPPGFFNGTGASGVALQPDGKIILAGLYTAPGGLNHFGLARYNPDGTLDTTFGSGGIVNDVVDSDDFATAVAVQPDGKIVVVGAAGPNFSAVNFAVVRYNPDGSRDSTFGSDGVVETPPPFATDAAANAVVIQPDGKIVVGGHTSTSGGDFHYAVLRYQSNGALDPTFGSGGEVFDNFGPGFDSEDVRGLALQPDGKVVAVGVVFDFNRSAADLALARYNPDGGLDKSFHRTGRTTLNVNGGDDAAAAVALQADGKIVVVGSDGVPGGSFFLEARYNADGTLDSTFGPGGTATQKFSQDGNDNAHAVAIQADGNVVVAGTAAEGNSDSNFALVRLTVPPQADVALTMGAQPSRALFGQNVSFTLVVHNRGPDAATDVFVDDPLPSGLVFVSAAPAQGTFVPGSGIWVVGTLANGATAVLHLTARVAALGPLVNRAEAGADQFDPDLPNNVAVVIGTNPAPVISLRLLLASSHPSPAAPAARPARPLPALAALRADMVFLEGLYLGHRHRAARPAELAFWMNELLLGLPPAAVARLI